MDAKYKVLIVDDDTDLVRVLSERLEYEGFQTVEAYEGVRALECVHKESPDLVILDLRMPAGSGQSVLQRLRSRQETKDLPVIVLTAMSGQNLEEETRSAGADDFVQKPCDMIILLQKIRAMLKNRPSQHP